VEHLPALRVLREFCPGNVTRHFGVWATNKRHWIPLPGEAPGEQGLRVDVARTYRAALVDVVGTGNERVAVYAPVAAALEPVSDAVKDASAVHPDWEFHVSALGGGCAARLSRGAGRLLEGLTAHLHVQGGGIRTVRCARTARGTVWDPRSRPVRLRFGLGDRDTWTPAALGVDIHCDAFEGTVKVPDQTASPNPQERTNRLRHGLEVEADLPESISTFDRESLVDVVLRASTAARLDGRDLFQERDLAEALGVAATTLGLITGGERHEHHADEQDWSRWCNDPQVLSAVRVAVAEVSNDERSPAWAAWWRRRYTLPVAHLARAPQSALCAGVDRVVLLAAEPQGKGRILLKFRNTIEIEGEPKPALIADALSLLVTEA